MIACRALLARVTGYNIPDSRFSRIRASHYYERLVKYNKRGFGVYEPHLSFFSQFLKERLKSVPRNATADTLTKTYNGLELVYFAANDKHIKEILEMHEKRPR